MTEFDLQTYLSEMEGRLTDRFDSVDDKLEAIPALETRTALLEQTVNTLTKGLWALLAAFLSTAAAYLTSIFRPA
tara:strand:+ start:1117 stop:1341 length:225 start_codon:yes stop_codon:yes gene_type:complete